MYLGPSLRRTTYITFKKIPLRPGGGGGRVLIQYDIIVQDELIIINVSDNREAGDSNAQRDAKFVIVGMDGFDVRATTLLQKLSIVLRR